VTGREALEQARSETAGEGPEISPSASLHFRETTTRQEKQYCKELCVKAEGESRDRINRINRMERVRQVQG